MRKTEANGLTYFSVPGWDERSGAAHGFFTRAGGVSPAPYDSLNLGTKGGDELTHVQENLRRTAQAFSIPTDRVFCASQVHGDRILEISGCRQSIFGSGPSLRGDGLMTEERDVYLGILTADCLPLLLLDPGRSVVGAVHAGWRSTVKGIAPKAVRALRRAFGCKPEDLLVAFGPAIGPCCYVVREEVTRTFLKADEATRRFLHPEEPGRWKMNLAGINQHQLCNEGVQEGNLFLSNLCTSCRKDLFFSVRAEGEPTGRQIALIGLRPEPTERSPDKD